MERITWSFIGSAVDLFTRKSGYLDAESSVGDIEDILMIV